MQIHQTSAQMKTPPFCLVSKKQPAPPILPPAALLKVFLKCSHQNMNCLHVSSSHSLSLIKPGEIQTRHNQWENKRSSRTTQAAPLLTHWGACTGKLRRQPTPNLPPSAEITSPEHPRGQKRINLSRQIPFTGTAVSTVPFEEL